MEIIKNRLKNKMKLFVKSFLFILCFSYFLPVNAAVECGPNAKYGLYVPGLYEMSDCPKYTNAEDTELQCSTGGRGSDSCFLTANPIDGGGEFYEDETGYYVYTGDCHYYPTYTLGQAAERVPSIGGEGLVPSN